MRPDQTINIPPPRRRVYPAARTRMDMNMPPAEDTFTPSVDWNLWRGLTAIQAHANQRSNPIGDGLDSMRANTGGETLTFTSLGSGVQVRVPHGLKRIPSAVVWFRSPDPTLRVIGNPAGQTTGGFQNNPWTEREVWLQTNAPVGTVFQVVVS